MKKKKKKKEEQKKEKKEKNWFKEGFPKPRGEKPDWACPYTGQVRGDRTRWVAMQQLMRQIGTASQDLLLFT